MEYTFVFKNFHIWKHFFKPIHYRDEHEIRLLHFKNNGDKFKWIKTGDSQIFAPVIEFSIERGKNNFPLTNVEQIRYYKALQEIEEDGDCPVTLSKIKGYR